jgi:hypothetical protein
VDERGHRSLIFGVTHDLKSFPAVGPDRKSKVIIGRETAQVSAGSVMPIRLMGTVSILKSLLHR